MRRVRPQKGSEVGNAMAGVYFCFKGLGLGVSESQRKE